MEVISLDGNESDSLFQKSRTMLRNKEENPGAILKSPSSPLGSKLLLRKNEMQAERLQSSSSNAKENERKVGNDVSSPFATKLLMRKHETQKNMEVISLDGNESDSLFQKAKQCSTKKKKIQVQF